MSFMNITGSPRWVDPIGAPIGAFESDTQAAIQSTTPYSEHALLHAIAATLLLAGLLSAVIKLDRVVTSTGRILPVNGSYFVQPLDRAIVTGILVHNGDLVKKGQVLATLDPTFAQADLKDIQQKEGSALALVARLRAEQDGLPFLADASSPYQAMQAAIAGQREAEHQQSLLDFDARIAAASAMIARSRQDAHDYSSRLELAKELEQSQVALQAKGFGSRVRIITAADSRIETERLAAQSLSLAAQASHDLAALRAQRAVYVGKWRDEVASQLVAAQNELDAATRNVAKASKVKDLSNLTAPEDAVVLKVGHASVGSIIEGGSSAGSEPLFTLVPLGGDLEAEVEIAAKDVGFIHPGDKVNVKLDAYKFTEYGTIKGVIKTISEGSFTQGDNGVPHAPFFRVRVVFTDPKPRHAPTGFRLIPGMTLGGDIMVGRRTILSYLMDGVLRTSREAMREP